MAAIMKTTRVPEHIPKNLVYDFHIFGDDKYIADPYARAQELLREAPPVFWSTRGNCWYVASYQALTDAFRRPDLFSNVLMPHVPDDYAYTPIPLSVDPPRHAIYATPLKEFFSPRSVMKLEAQMRELAQDLIANIASKGECEFIEAIAEPYPILIFFQILGVPKERFSEFRRVAVEYLNEADMKIRFQKMTQADVLMSEFIEARRKQPQDDLISHLWTLQIDGKPITLVDMRRYAMMLFTAGLDSVTNGMGHSMSYFARHPQLQAWMRENPKELSAACEELLRRHGVTTPPRRIAKDEEFYGAPLRAGDFVEMYVISGNLDDRTFAKPTEFQVKRSSTHLTFGYGIHRCIGAHLARLEVRTLFEEWMRRIPEVHVLADRTIAYDPGHVLRIARLPLGWDSEKASRVQTAG
jgi:cytochrome P450